MLFRRFRFLAGAILKGQRKNQAFDTPLLSSVESVDSNLFDEVGLSKEPKMKRLSLIWIYDEFYPD